jgi:hypothetical protein
MYARVADKPRQTNKLLFKTRNSTFAPWWTYHPANLLQYMKCTLYEIVTLWMRRMGTRSTLNEGHGHLDAVDDHMNLHWPQAFTVRINVPYVRR